MPKYVFAISYASEDYSEDYSKDYKSRNFKSYFARNQGQ